MPPLIPDKSNSDSDSGSEPVPSGRRRLRKMLWGLGLGLGSSITIGSVVLYVWGNRIVTNLLLPQVSDALSDSIQRPVELGDVEGFGFWGVSLGETVIPSTDTDDSSMTVNAIQINIGLRSLILQQTAKARVVLVSPEVSLVENENGQWLALNLPEPSEAEQPIKLEIESIEVRNASLSALPYTEDASKAVVTRRPIQLKDTDVQIEFLGESAQEIKFKLGGKVVAEAAKRDRKNRQASGRFVLKGSANLETQTGKVNARIKNLPSTGANLLLSDSFGIRSGEWDGKLTVAADFNEGKLDQSSLDVRGTVKVLGGEFITDALESPIQNIRSQLKFSGQTVSLKDTSLQLNDTLLLVEGDVGVEEGYDLTAQIPSVTVEEVQALADVELPIAAEGAFTLVTDVTGAFDRPNVEGRLANLEPVLIDKVGLDSVVATFSTALPDFELSEFNLDEFRAQPTTGGVVTANGKADLSDLENVTFQLEGKATVPTDAIAQVYGVKTPPDLVIGTLNADFDVAGDLDNQNASANWRLSQGLIVASGQARATDLQQPSFELSGRANVPVDGAARAYDVNVPDGIVLGRLSADFEVAGDRQNQNAAADWRLSQGVISASGEATVRDLRQPLFQLSGQADAPVDVLAQAYDVDLPEDMVLGRLSAAFTADGSLETQTAFADWQLSQGSVLGRGTVSLIDRIVALETARLITEEGTATAAATLNLNTQTWRATANTDQIAVGRFTDLASGLLSADLVASGNLRALNLDQIEASGNAVIANAQVQLPEMRAPLLEPGDWATAFEWQGDRIAVNRFSAPGLQADGTIGVDFTQDIPIGDLALNVALQSYNLARINGLLPDSANQYVQLDGFTSFNGQLLGTLDNPQLSGDAQLNALAVNDLSFETLSGPVDFALADGGRIDLQGQQEQLQLTAVAAPQKPVPFWPVSFTVRHQDFLARGKTEGDVLEAEVVQLPLERLAIAPAADYGLGPLSGLLRADITANLADFANPTAKGSLSITDPGLSPVDAERFSAEFAYADGIATLNRGELLLEQSRYLLSGRAKVLGEIEYQGELAIAQGRIEDLIPIAQALDLTAFAPDAGQSNVRQGPTGSAADLDLEPIGLSGGTLLDKLENFVAFLEAHPEAAAIAQGQTSPEEQSLNVEQLAGIELPPLEELKGEFTGKITLAGTSLNVADTTANFDIQGDSWAWGENTPPNAFALRGDVAQSAVDIDTAFVNAGETQINLTADGNLDRLNGQLVVNGLPLAFAQLIAPLPVDVEGDLSLATTLGGSWANPTITGELAIAHPKINSYPLVGVKTDFNYRNAILAVDTKVAVDEQARPISVEGRIPYALPFSNVVPPTELLSVTAVVPNGNLEIINALTDDTVQWQSGQGKVTVNVGGTFSQPQVAGRASFSDAVVSSTLLADDVTNLSGDVLFNLEQVSIRQLQAQIKDGRVSIDGRLPLLPSGGSLSALLTPAFKLDDLSAWLTQQSLVRQSLVQQSPTQQSPTQQSPKLPSRKTGALTIALEKLPVDYSNLVSGIFDGQLLVTGAALTPTVTGSVEIDNGFVNATNVLQQAGSSDIGSVRVEEGSLAEAINAYRANTRGAGYLGLSQKEQRLKVSESVLSESVFSENVFNNMLGQVALRDLRIRLGNRLSIAAPPVFRITALGDLSVNGTLADIQPSGTVELLTGEVNLFSSRFRLDRGAPNTATFIPEKGLDPVLDVALLARVRDADINPVPPSSDGFVGSEVNATTVDATGEVQFLRVKASAQGPASQITDNLTLSSRPSRKQGELLTLLSRNTVTGIANASLTQIGGFLGSGGRLSALGDRVADAIGLQSFSVFPTTDIGDDSTVGLGVGVEASAAIGNRFNITVFDIINNSNPPQLGVFYRLTDELNLRGASNLDDTDLELEYRIKF